MSALSAMQDKTQHLENSLSAETRIKLDLFSALGDAKRQLEIAQGPSKKKKKKRRDADRFIYYIGKQGLAVIPPIP